MPKTSLFCLNRIFDAEINALYSNYPYVGILFSKASPIYASMLGPSLHDACACLFNSSEFLLFCLG